MARQAAGDTAQAKREEDAWKREEDYKMAMRRAAEDEALARLVNAGTGWAAAFGDLSPEMSKFLRLPAGNAGAGPIGSTNAPTKGGRFPVSRRDGTPPSTKPGETPRTPDNAAPQVPVQVAPKPPTADVKLDSASGIGTGLLDSIRSNTWGVGPDSKNMQALVESYLQKSNPAEPPSILDALGKELGYDQRRPAIKK